MIVDDEYSRTHIGIVASDHLPWHCSQHQFAGRRKASDPDGRRRGVTSAACLAAGLAALIPLQRLIH
jgi:hypothetical protein